MKKKTILSENATLVEEEDDPTPTSPITALASLSKGYHKTDDGKVCCICKGHYPLPKGYVKGLCPVRNHPWLPDPDVFVCAECCVTLLKAFVNHSANAFYKEWDWEGTEDGHTEEDEITLCGVLGCGEKAIWAARFTTSDAIYCFCQNHCDAYNGKGFLRDPTPRPSASGVPIKEKETPPKPPPKED